MSPTTHLLVSGLAAMLYAIGVHADGTGLIGWGKTLYNPTCCFSCRNVVRNLQLECTPIESSENHGTAHNPVTTPADCFVNDHVFLKTMALCIDTYCPLSDDPPSSLVEDYWASHLGTGTLGNYDYVPAMSYQAALDAAREDESGAARNTNSSSDDYGDHRRRTAKLWPRHGGHDSATNEGLVTFDVSSPLPTTAGGSDPLNETSFVDPEAWQLQYNYQYDFETNEAGHSTMMIVIAIVAIFLPVALSLPRFLPGLTRSRGWAYSKAMLVHPAAFGRRHREPVAALGTVPNRGQALYIVVISILNLLLWLGPYVIHQPQASFTSLKMQTISIVGNRAGVMAMGNVVALFLFAARNNVLLYITDWSYSTYLLLHRWLGYWAVFHTIVHSFMLLANYLLSGTYEDELVRKYWIWGIVGTVAVSAILPFSLLWFRQKFYELFLASHIVLSLLFIIGYYYHIWYVYEYNWGYEIWIFIAGGIWGADRVLRLARTAWQGSRMAVVSVIPDVDGEYIRIEVEGKRLEDGIVYLGFPTLGWRFWETHPFSVAGSAPGSRDSEQPAPAAAVTLGEADPEKAASASTGPPDAMPSVSRRSKGDSTIFYARTRGGVTKQLASRVYGASGAPSVRLRVLLEGPYHHSGQVSSQLARCSDLLCIAGGVGITACLPYVRKGAPGSTKLFWSSRTEGLATALTPTLAGLPGGVQVETVVGRRLELEAILGKELVGGQEGALAVVVCGPPGMADDARQMVVETARTNPLSRPYVLVDEAFGW
ncbi:hypothetical protein QQX98_006348 [Neonectria punicea]|uniref:Ferric oxidoreductase domain-containing protein n=1 Tax=Neonectria punicea TaxID=979145 RepID=A0ABR1H149_9HYPO